MQAGLESTFGQVLNDALVRCQELMFGARRDSSSMYRVGVIVVEDEDVFVARDGRANKLSSLI